MLEATGHFPASFCLRYGLEPNPPGRRTGLQMVGENSMSGDSITAESVEPASSYKKMTKTMQ
jgi:hypothetical protein